MTTNRFLKCLLALVIFTSLAFVMTYPLFIKANDSISGFYSTDEPSVWYFWWLKYAHNNNLDHRTCQYIAYPFGQDYGVFDLLYPAWSAFKKVMAVTTNPCFAYNIEIILSFILSGLFMYLLMVFISQDAFISLFSGIIYAFSPYHFARAWQHIGLVHIQWMPLYIYALLKIKGDNDRKNMFFLGIAFFLVASFDFYYLYFMILAGGIFILYALSRGVKKNLPAAFHICAAIAITLLAITAILWPFIRSRILLPAPSSVSVWGLNRPFEDLFAQSARPLSYFLPSTEHPLFGWIARNFIGTNIYGMSLTEHALYLGWIPLILAFLAFKRWKKQGQSSSGTVSDREQFYIGFFVILAISAWLFSQPPWWNIFGFKVYMPSFFMYKALPMFRAYCRFGIVLMLAVAVLAGWGLRFILDRFKTQKTKIAVTALFSGLVLFEFWNYPPYKIIDLSRAPEAYYWLKSEPADFVIAEYPLDTRGPNEKYKFFQTVHEKKMINGTIPGTYPNKVADSITKLSDLNTARTLKWMGVKYVLVHRKDYLKTDLLEDKQELEDIPKGPGLKFIRSFPAEGCPQEAMLCVRDAGAIDVYEVTASALAPVTGGEFLNGK